MRADQRHVPAEFDCHGCGQHIIALAKRFPLPVPLLCAGCELLGIEHHKELMGWLEAARRHQPDAQHG